MKARYFFILLFVLSGCIEPHELKILNWNNNAVRWSVVNGGATTPFLWKIYYQKNGSRQKKLIFQSISSPSITDISISTDYLLIHCDGYGKQVKLIQINMREIDDFIANPIKYRKSILEQTNDSYHEPEFIWKTR